MTQNFRQRPEINNLPKDPSWVQIWTSECVPLRRYCVNTKNALFHPKIGKFWPKIFTTSRKSITYPKIHLGCKYERLNVCHCADIVWIPKTHFFTPKLVNFHPKLCQNRTNKIAKVTLGHKQFVSIAKSQHLCETKKLQRGGAQCAPSSVQTLKNPSGIGLRYLLSFYNLYYCFFIVIMIIYRDHDQQLKYSDPQWIWASVIDLLWYWTNSGNYFIQIIQA